MPWRLKPSLWLECYKYQVQRNMKRLEGSLLSPFLYLSQFRSSGFTAAENFLSPFVIRERLSFSFYGLYKWNEEAIFYYISITNLTN